MALGGPAAAARGLLARLEGHRERLKRSASTMTLTTSTETPPVTTRPSETWHNALSSRISSKYGSLKSSMTRTHSARAGKRDKQRVRAQDIFKDPPDRNDTPCVELFLTGSELTLDADLTPTSPRTRSSTPFSALSLERPLPVLPREPDESPKIDTDVCSDDFEGYLDILAYLQRDLPTTPDQPPERQTPSPPRDQDPNPVGERIQTPPTEQDWLASGPHSRLSTLSRISADDDELRGVRSLSASALPSRATSASARTVTPMSSVDSDKGLRGYNKMLAVPPAVAPTIAEVSEPDTSPSHRPPEHHAKTMPLVCCHCGRDPSEKEMSEARSTPEPSAAVPEVESPQTPPDTPPAVVALGPAISVFDEAGNRYKLYPETSQYIDEGGTSNATTPRPGRVSPFDFSSPPERPTTSNPYLQRVLSPHRALELGSRAPVDFDAGIFEADEVQDIPPSVVQTVPPPPHPRPSNRDPYDKASPLSPNGLSPAPAYPVGEGRSSFWKNPDGVILVYQGIEVEGKEVYFGNDISYLGSYYDEDEGSSGLGSRPGSFDLGAVSGGGLPVIPEDRSSDDLSADEWSVH